MSFIFTEKKGKAYAPGWFLARQSCVRKTRQMHRNGAADGDFGKYVPMGTIYPSNDANAEGIVYEDVDVESGDAPGSVVLAGYVYENRLPVTLAAAAKTALEAKGFVFVQEQQMVRPDFGGE